MATISNSGGRLEDVKRLITKVDIECKSNTVLTGLHYAASRGHAHVVRFLLKNNASVDSRAYFNKTPLHYAVGYGRNDTIEVLCDHTPAADTNAEDNGKQTPLHYAAKNGKTSTCEL